jgi:flagellar biosynthesis/type III secretory pathway chaperone
MPDMTLVNILEKLLKLHESLLDLGLSKTEIVKKGDMEGLQQMLKDEQKHIAAINMMEKERHKAAKQFLGSNAEDITISNCIANAEPELKETLSQLQTDILAVIEKLQDRNELNQMLIYQSLQFVNMSLDMFKPRTESVNYSRPVQDKAPKPSFTIFDSKA